MTNFDYTTTDGRDAAYGKGCESVELGHFYLTSAIIHERVSARGRFSAARKAAISEATGGRWTEATVTKNLSWAGAIVKGVRVALPGASADEILDYIDRECETWEMNGLYKLFHVPAPKVDETPEPEVTGESTSDEGDEPVTPDTVEGAAGGDPIASIVSIFGSLSVEDQAAALNMLDKLHADKRVAVG